MTNEKVLYTLGLELAELRDIFEETKSDLKIAIAKQQKERIANYKRFKICIQARINQTFYIAESLGFEWETLEEEARRIVKMGA